MKKNTSKLWTRTLAVCCVLSALSFAACGDGKKDDDANGGKSVADANAPDLSEKAGSEAIGFHNTLVEFNKTARAPLRKTLSILKDSIGWIERDGATHEKPMWGQVLIGINPLEKTAKFKIAPPASLPKADQEFFKARIASVKADAEALNKLIHEITAYYKANDYKDDKHKKIKDADPVITGLVQKIAQATGEMGERSEQIASAAERKALEKLPQGIFILNMRDIMAKAEEQINLITDERLVRQGSGTNFTDASKVADAAKVKDIADKLDAVTAELKELTAKTRDIKTDKISKNLAEAYANFFKALDDQQGTIRDKIRWIKEWGNAGSKGDIKNTADSYKNLLNRHNRFIDISNKEGSRPRK